MLLKRPLVPDSHRYTRAIHVVRSPVDRVVDCIGAELGRCGDEALMSREEIA
jgi:hypothetical protein